MKKINKLFIVLLLMICILGLSSCDRYVSNHKTISIVTTLFPEYEFINSILEGQKDIGKSVEVTLIVPYGSNSHTYDPSISDLITIRNADLFIYTSDEMEPWAQGLVNDENKKLNIYDAMLKKYEGFEELELISTNHDEHDHEHEHEENENIFDHINETIKGWIEKIFPEHHHSYDPHFWTNMLFAEYMVEVIYDKLVEIIPDPDSTKKLAMRENADRYIQQLRIIDQDFFDIVSLCAEEKKVLYFGCPFSFYYFVKRYGINYVLTYSTCSTEVDPSLITVIDVINKMKENDAKVIITKELTSTDAADTISSYTGAKVLELNSGHNISANQEGKVTFLSIMYQNTDVLAEALDIDTSLIENYHEERGGE